jgi:hypothetical protein
MHLLSLLLLFLLLDFHVIKLGWALSIARGLHAVFVIDCAFSCKNRAKQMLAHG